jgi:hypothetical protein
MVFNTVLDRWAYVGVILTRCFYLGLLLRRVEWQESQR